MQNCIAYLFLYKAIDFHIQNIMIASLSQWHVDAEGGAFTGF